MQLVFVAFPPTKAGMQEKLKLQNRMMSTSNTIKKAAAELSDPQRMSASQKKRFVKWFGEKTGKDGKFDYTPVTNRFQKLSHGFTNATINVYRYTGLVGLGVNLNFCDGTLAAALRAQRITYKNAETGRQGVGHILIVCPDFWNAQIMGRTYSPADTQLGTLMHEMTHMFAGTVDKGYDGTDGTAYGEANCLRTARDAVDAARENADNYMYYMTELYFRGY